jgi:hypothetical protein
MRVAASVKTTAQARKQQPWDSVPEAPGPRQLVVIAPEQQPAAPLLARDCAARITAADPFLHGGKKGFEFRDRICLRLRLKLGYGCYS